MEIHLLSKDLENIEAAYSRLDDQLSEFQELNKQIEKEAREEVLAKYKGKKETLLREHAIEMQRLKKEFQSAELERLEFVESSSKAFRELCAFWEFRKANIQKNFEQNSKDQLAELDAQQTQCLKTLLDRSEDVKRKALEAEDERQRHISLLTQTQKRLQSFPEAVKRSLEEEHTLVLEDDIKELRKQQKVSTAQITKQLQEEREECVRLRQEINSPELERDAELRVSEALEEMEERSTQILNEREARNESRLEQLNAVNGQLFKDIERLKSKRKEAVERQEKAFLSAEKQAQKAHQKEISVLIEEEEGLKNELKDIECELIVLEKTRVQAHRLLRQKFSHELISFIEDEIGRTNGFDIKERLELQLRWERNKARISCLQEQAGCVAEAEEDDLNAKISLLQKELNSLKDSLRFEQMKLDASQNAWKQTFVHHLDFTSEQNSEIIYLSK